MNLSELQADLRHFAAVRDWQPFHTPKNLTTALMVEAAELAKVFQWLTPAQSRVAHQDPQLLRIFVLSQARYATAMVPVAGQVGNIAIGQFTSEGYDDRTRASPVYSAVEATVRAPSSIYRAIEGEGNPRAAVRDGLTAVAVLTGLPTGPLGYLADEDREGVTVRGLVTGADR